jgi:hypothetical protein
VTRCPSLSLLLLLVRARSPVRSITPGRMVIDDLPGSGSQ